jgi:hypothetical protein
VSNASGSGPTQILRALAALVGIASVISAFTIWATLSTVDRYIGAIPMGTETNWFFVFVGLGTLVGGLLLATSCFVLSAISENLAAMANVEKK